MVEHLGWESVFFLNVPIGIVAFVVAMRTVTESRSDEARQLDIPGLVLGTRGALFRSPTRLIEANQKGWSDPVIVAVARRRRASCGAFLLLGAPQPARDDAAARSSGSRRSRPATPWRSRSRSGMFATFFFLSLYMQSRSAGTRRSRRACGSCR